MAEGCSNSRWYALQIRHERGRPSGRAEDRVIRGLNISGIESYYPTYAERSTTHGRRQVTIQKSLFPGYLFARFDPTETWASYWESQALRTRDLKVGDVVAISGAPVVISKSTAVLSLPGVAAIVSAGLRPIAIPDEKIAAVRALLASPMSITPCPFVPVNCGDLVEVTLGPLKGQIGKVIEYRGRRQAVFVLAIEGIDGAVKTHVLREHIRPLPKQPTKVIQMPAPAALPKAA